MARVLITGSTDGLGLAAAHSLVDKGHSVVLHARSEARAVEVADRLPAAQEVLMADLASLEQTLALAERANALAPFDAIIHNAGVGANQPQRISTPEGHSHVLAINVLAPYILTARISRPRRLIYISSMMHRWVTNTSLDDIDWVRRPWDGSEAYSESKLYDAALACAISRRWPDVLSNSLEPGWVPTKAGGPNATDDLALGHVTQVWLATCDDPAATVTGRYFYHQRQTNPHEITADAGFQDALLKRLTELTGVELPG